VNKILQQRLPGTTGLTKIAFDFSRLSQLWKNYAGDRFGF
jgi:hypothetical protein